MPLSLAVVVLCTCGFFVFVSFVVRRVALILVESGGRERGSWHMAFAEFRSTQITHILVNLLTDATNPKQDETCGEETLIGNESKVTERCHSRTCMVRCIERFVGSLISEL